MDNRKTTAPEHITILPHFVSCDSRNPPAGTPQPWRCPVCFGTGQVDADYYNRTTPDWTGTSTVPETCRSCGGAGVVWSPA